MAIEESAQSWMPYAQGDRVVFLNAMMQTDTLVIHEQAEETIIEGADECPDLVTKRRAGGTLAAQPNHKMNVSIKRHFLSIGVGYGNATINTNSNTKESGNALFTFHPIESINGVAYTDVYRLNELYSAIQSLCYAKNIGLVQFTDSLGTTWLRQ